MHLKGLGIVKNGDQNLLYMIIIEYSRAEMRPVQDSSNHYIM